MRIVTWNVNSVRTRLEKVEEWLRKHEPDVLCLQEIKLAFLGDFNIAPEDRDVYDPDGWRGGIHFSEPEHAQLARFMQWGLTDTLRMHHQEAGIYSWWDYRQLAFQKRKGLRIDLVLATDSLAATCTECVVDKDARRGKGTSDHAPVVADFDV